MSTRRLALLFFALAAAWWSSLRAHAEEPVLHAKVIAGQAAHASARWSTISEEPLARP